LGRRKTKTEKKMKERLFTPPEAARKKRARRVSGTPVQKKHFHALNRLWESSIFPDFTSVV